jgi:hypothetical protein
MIVHMLSALPLGAKVLGPAPHDGFVWIDLNTMGSHLPQMYRPAELKPIDREIAEAEGLCGDCLGYGVPQGYVAPLAASVDELPTKLVCQNCHGTGRPSMILHVQRTPDMIQSSIEVLEHAYIAELPDGGCKGCGNPQDNSAHV